MTTTLSDFMRQSGASSQARAVAAAHGRELHPDPNEDDPAKDAAVATVDRAAHRLGRDQAASERDYDSATRGAAPARVRAKDKLVAAEGVSEGVCAVLKDVGMGIVHGVSHAALGDAHAALTGKLKRGETRAHRVSRHIAKLALGAGAVRKESLDEGEGLTEAGFVSRLSDGKYGVFVRKDGTNKRVGPPHPDEETARKYQQQVRESATWGDALDEAKRDQDMKKLANFLGGAETRSAPTQAQRPVTEDAEEQLGALITEKRDDVDALMRRMYDDHHARAHAAIEGIKKQLDKHREIVTKQAADFPRYGFPASHAFDMKNISRNLEDMHAGMAQNCDQRAKCADRPGY